MIKRAKGIKIRNVRIQDIRKVSKQEFGNRKWNIQNKSLKSWKKKTKKVNWKKRTTRLNLINKQQKIKKKRYNKKN